MKRTKSPAVKRTRRHVVIRLTPDEAHAAFWLATTAGVDQLPPRAKRANQRVRAKLQQARQLADQQPEPRPNRTSIGHTFDGKPPTKP